MRFVVDTSALVAIVNAEPEAERFHRLLLDHEPLISCGTLIETLRVMQVGLGAPSLDVIDRLIGLYGIEQVPVESDRGFCHALELLVKSHRLGWGVGEVPALWFERKHGASRFRVLKWLPAYLRWYGYAFGTTFLRRPANSVARTRAAP